MSIVKRITVVDQLINEVRAQILRRELLPGQPITEDAISVKMGVSRPTMRQALAALESEGLLSRNTTNRVLHVTQLSSDDVSQAYRARRVLELAGIDAIALAPQSRLDDFRRVMEEIEQAVASDTVDVQVRTDFKMHETIVGLLDSPDLSALELQLLTRLRLASIEIAGEDEWQSMIKANRHLCELITSRRVADAKEALSARLAESEKMVLLHLVQQ
ncbi:DNA-binding GntR family transcriptional regulator [Paenarthrobacter nitroguajacolicus]|uniref:GntR family transcriptional regulator n=1 Tax=Paenarthrobacter nitroguajacolicus TaxID=211146 RepID=UPI00285C02E8|nr:GntR family transcriptional regulator [Paenarthrobacter nitroguajacolicus]MDR6989281.1 DNA-binding GntR family transcriptional regulator [Paenarthrobacter nitroguajacolicus]